MKNPLLAKISLILVVILFSQFIMINSGIATNKNRPNQSLEINLFAKNYSFSPNKITVPVGTNVTLVLHSNDTIHGFFLEGYDVTQIVCNEHYFTLSFIADTVGTFIFKCNEPACGPYHPYMVGSLTVNPNSQLTIQSLVIVSAFIFITTTFLVKWRKSNGDQ